MNKWWLNNYQVYKSNDGEYILETQRDCDGSFDPKLVKKNNPDLRPRMRKSFGCMLKVCTHEKPYKPLMNATQQVYRQRLYPECLMPS